MTRSETSKYLSRIPARPIYSRHARRYALATSIAKERDANRKPEITATEVPGRLNAPKKNLWIWIRC